MRKTIIPISRESIRQIESHQKLKTIFHKYSVPSDMQKKIFQSLARGIDRKDIEVYFIKGKDNLKPTEKINLGRLRKDFLLLLQYVPSTYYLTKEKKTIINRWFRLYY